MKRIALSFVILIAIISYASAGEKKPLKPSPKDKCAVCGMFVAKYPDFLAQIIFKDGSYAMFDGPKDMFRYYLNMKTYNPSKKIADIDSVYVTDYYTLTSVDGLKAYFVTNSDVNGPMGSELVPFIKEADSRAFMKDHNGRAVLRFNEVTAAVLKGTE
jgi:copper chaperone NosL